MLLPRLDRRGLAAFDAALRAGEPVRLGPRALASTRLPADELVPLAHAVDAPELVSLLPPAARPGSGIAVSVVIPTHRQAPVGLAALQAQDVDVELLVLANGRYTDGVRVPWTGHGSTRNAGVRLARHPYVFLSVDDALPLGAGFLRTLVEALESGGFDAVTARQIPWPTSDPVTRARLRAWTPPPRANTQPLATLDNVAALYRREALIADPFDDVVIAEDWAWARRHRVGYVPAAAVVHAHPRRFGELYRRTRDIHRERARAGEPASVPDVTTLVRALPGVIGRDAPGALGELLGQFVGGRG
jgi:hypothetical protein